MKAAKRRTQRVRRRAWQRCLEALKNELAEYVADRMDDIAYAMLYEKSAEI